MFSDQWGGQSGTLNVFLKPVTYRPTLSKFRGGQLKKHPVDYLLEKLRRSRCYACNIITPLQEPSIWTIIFFKVSTLKPLPHWRKRPCKPATGRTALTPVTWSRGTWPPTRPRWWWAPALQHLPNETLTGMDMIP